MLFVVSESILAEQLRNPGGFIETVKARLASEFAIPVEVRPVERDTIMKSGGKIQRVIDKRKL